MKISEATNYEEFKTIYLEYLESYNLPKERIDYYLEKTKVSFSDKDTITLVGTEEEKQIGYAILGVFPTHIQLNGIYAKEGFVKQWYFKVLSEGRKKTNELNKRMFQVFNIQQLNWKEEIEKLGFLVSTRVRFNRNLEKKITTKYKLPKKYKTAILTKDRIDEGLEVISNSLIKENYDFFIQFRDFEIIKYFFNVDVLKNNQLRSDSPIILYKNKIVGLALLKSFGQDLTHIWDLVVLPEHRNRGLGHYLLQKSVQICKDGGNKEISYDVQEQNEIGMKLPQKHNFKEQMRFLGATYEFSDEKL